MPKSTSERLAEVLEQAHAPQKMIDQARSGYYDDYKSPLAAPIIQLVQDATRHELYTIAEKARQGEFDAEKWEAEEWAKSPEGRETFQSFLKGVSPPNVSRTAKARKKRGNQH